MANELNIALIGTGLTVTANIYTAGWALVSGAIACPEIGGATGRYSGSVPAATLGNAVYNVVFVSAGANVGSGRLTWDAQGDKELAPEFGIQELWKDHGLDPDSSKVITELTAGTDYDEDVGTQIHKDTTRVGAVTTINRL
jgi:hypothetical protein